MFKPFDIFYEKNFPNEENAESIEEATKQWNELKSKKRLKFIKKAEKKYDSHVEKNPDEPPFHTYLSAKELEMLLKSYGLPEKMLQNSKLYYIKKKQDEAQSNLEDDANLDEVLRNTKTEAENDWTKFSEEEKSKLLNEFHQKQEEFDDNFFQFARNLPENRIVDYKELVKKKPDATPRERSKKLVQRREIKGHENLNKKFTPFEVFLEKHREEFDPNENLKARNEARTKFKDLSDKKRLKYIKKAESIYDEFYKNSTEEYPLFSTYLNKSELKLLLESYGMPEGVPNSFSAYYYRKQTKEGATNMKEVFDSLRKLSQEEKDKLIKEHSTKHEEYIVKNKQFLDSLPLARLEDYNTSRGKQNKRASLTPARSPNKRIKKEKEENGKANDSSIVESDD